MNKMKYYTVKDMFFALVILIVCCLLAPLSILFVIPGVYLFGKTAAGFFKQSIGGISMPTFWIHQMFTRTLEGSENVYFDENDRRHVKYANNKQLILFGIFGNILYFTFVLYFLVLLFAFTPYNDGFLIKKGFYEVGTEIVYKNGNEYVSSKVEEITKTENGKVRFVVNNRELSIRDIEGEYDDNSSSVGAFTNSFFSFFNYSASVIKDIF